MIWSRDSRWLSWHGNESDSFQSFDMRSSRLGPRISSPRHSLAAGWSADGTLFAAPGVDAGGAGVFLWNWPAGTLARPLRGNNALPSESAWSQDFSKIAAADQKTLLIWQTTGENLARVVIGEGWIASIAWHPQEDFIAVRMNDPNRLAYYSSQGEPLFQTELSPANGQFERPVAWSSDGRWLLISHGSNSYQLFDAQGKPAEITLTAYNTGPPFWRPGSSSFLTTGGYNPKLIDARKPDEPIVPFQSAMQSIGWSPDGRWLAAASLGGELVLWDADARQTSHLATSGQNNILTPYWSDSAERWLVHAERNIYSGSPPRIVAIGRKGELLQSTLVPDKSGAALIGLRREGRELVVRRNDGHRTWMEAWRPESLVAPTEIAPPSQVGGPIIAVKSSSADDRLLIRARDGKSDEAIWLTDPSGKTVQRLVAEPGGYYDGMAFREKGDRFALTWRSKDSSSQELQVWEPTKPSRVLTVRGFSGSGLAFSPDGRILALEGRELVLIDLSSGDIIRRFDKGHGGRAGASWHPTHARIATTTDGDHITEIDVKSGPARDLPILQPLGVCWTSDGTQLLTTSQSGVMRSFRNQSTASNWTTVLLPEDQWATFSPGGRLLAGSADATRFLTAVIEREDGTFEMLDYADFVAKHGPKAAIPSVKNTVELEVNP